VAADAEGELTLAEFLRERPCLEELDGYLNALKPGSDARVLGLELSEDGLTAEILRESEAYRKRLMKGLTVPYQSHMERGWDYQFGKAPTKLRERPPPSLSLSPAARPGSASAAPPSGHAGSQATYLVAKPRR